MKVHRATIEVLIDLYTQCHNVFDEEFHVETDDMDAMEAAAIDYMTSPVRARFCSLIKNLDDEVCQELIALMWIGRDGESHSFTEFEALKERVVPNQEIANELLAELRLPEQWRKGMQLLNIE